MVVRPLVRRIVSPPKPEPTPEELAAAAAAAAPQLEAGEELAPTPSEAAKMIDMAQVQGQVHAQSVQKVGELAERNPNETAGIIREWLHQAA